VEQVVSVQFSGQRFDFAEGGFRADRIAGGDRPVEQDDG
jgi:hypothetical protein